MEHTNAIDICAGVEAIGSKGHFDWIRSIEDSDVRNAVMEHVLVCPRCSRINREALAFASEERPCEETSWLGWLLKPLAEWTPITSIPNPVYSGVPAPEEQTQEWTLDVGESEEMCSATLRLVYVDNGNDLKQVMIQSDNPNSVYLIRAFSGDQQVFEEKVRGQQPVVTTLNGELTSASAVEVIELRETL